MKRHKNEQLLRSFGEWLRKLRTEKKLTQEDLSFKTQANIGRIERGEINLTLSTLSKIADALNTGLPELLIFDRSPENNSKALSELPPIYGDPFLEIKRLRSELAFRNKEIEYLKKQIKSLEEINRLLKEKGAE